jgi:acetyltransferase-like isoleucine patch superfamily enzyme
LSKHIDYSARIGKGVVLGENIVIEAGVIIGTNTHIGHNVIIYHETKIGNNVDIEAGTILGRVPRSGTGSYRKVSQKLPPLEVGDSCVIGANAILYRGTRIGNQVLVGDLASVRERNVVGNQGIIGRLVMIEPNSTIGKNVIIQTGSHITGDSVIEDDAFLGDEVSTANDNKMGWDNPEYKGPHIKKAARVGSNATLLPGVVIGEGAVVAAGSVVTRDVPPYKVVMGVPARVVRDAPRR